MLDLGEDGLVEHIKTIGLYKTKARNIMRMAKILIEDIRVKFLKATDPKMALKYLRMLLHRRSYMVFMAKDMKILVILF